MAQEAAEQDSQASESAGKTAQAWSNRRRCQKEEVMLMTEGGRNGLGKEVGRKGFLESTFL